MVWKLTVSVRTWRLLLLALTAAAPPAGHPVGDDAWDPQRLDRQLMTLWQTHTHDGRVVDLPAMLADARAAGLPARADGAIRVEVLAEAASYGMVEALEALGAPTRALQARGRRVSGWLPVVLLDHVARMPGVRSVRPSLLHRSSGIAITQGDVALASGTARSMGGLSGSGVKVGVLSDSFGCEAGTRTTVAADVASADLPSSVEVLEEAASCSGTIDEGRAMLQIVHDVAPGAALSFHTAFNGISGFAQGLLDLAAAGAEVVVDDIIYFAEPMFADGEIAQAVDAVAAQGRHYHSAAGNFGMQSYEAAFADSSVQGSLRVPLFRSRRHDFDPGPGSDTLMAVTIPEGATVTIVMQWQDRYFSASGSPGSANDLDLGLFTGSGAFLRSSILANAGDDPVELITYENPAGSGNTAFQLAIERRTNIGPPTFSGVVKLVWNGPMTLNEYATNSSTLYGHANAAGATAVAAAFWGQTPAFGQTPPLVEPFSAKSGTPILFDANGNPVSVLRNKPQYTAADGGNNTLLGNDISNDSDSLPNFFGTSAAAPHASAIVALLIEAFPLTPAAVIEAALSDTAIAMADPTTRTGAGLIQAEAARLALAASVDSDDDGIVDGIETATGTDRFDVDSDDDGIADGGPAGEDRNGNGVVDSGETDPRLVDSDGDGIQDGTEVGVTAPIADPDGAGVLEGTDDAVFVPDADPVSTTDPLDGDTDGDRIPDGEEDLNRNGRLDPGESDPALAEARQQVPMSELALAALALLLAALASWWPAARADGNRRRSDDRST